jgi:uncharacterized membrane protein
MTTLLAMYLIFGGLLIVLAIPLLLDKIPPNPWYGFRVPSTLADERLWYKVNHYTARWLMLTGIVTVAGAVGFYFFLPNPSVDTYAWLCLAAFAVAFVPGIVFSARYLRRMRG